MTRNPWAGAIAAAIEATGKSIPTLSNESGIVRSQLYSWSNPDGYKPGKKSLRSLAKALGVAPESLQVESAPSARAPSAEPPKIAAVNVTYSDKETLVAVRLAHQEYAQQQNEQSWAYSVKVVNLVLESIRKAFEGAPPLTATVSAGATPQDEDAEIEEAYDVSRQDQARRAAEKLQGPQAPHTVPKSAAGNRR